MTEVSIYVHILSTLGLGSTACIVMYSSITNDHTLWHLWAMSGLLGSLWINIFKRKYYKYKSNDNIGKELLMSYLFGPTVFFVCAWRFRKDFKWYKKIVNRGYIVPTAANKEKYVWRRLTGDAK